jgi:hypothetical protein
VIASHRRCNFFQSSFSHRLLSIPAREQSQPRFAFFVSQRTTLASTASSLETTG